MTIKFPVDLADPKLNLVAPSTDGDSLGQNRVQKIIEHH